MARKVKEAEPASRTATKHTTGKPPRAGRSVPFHTLPGRKDSGKSQLAKGLFVPPDKSGKRKEKP